MSGHSKWAKLKHIKGALDAKKSAMFSKISRMISVAARDGADPTTNFKLRLAIEKAKQANMPRENIERAIKRGTGELGGEKIEEVIYEVFGPGGSAIIIEAITDNKNRTTANLRRILNQHGGTLGGLNSVLWMFKRKGVIRITNHQSQIPNLDEFQLKIIDAGVEDIKEEADELVIYTLPETLQKVKEIIESAGIKIDYAEIEWFADNLIKISPEDQKKVEAIFAALDEDPDINDYYTNIG
jgi:YebC/PmpR family DNA-binding regulatory protein